MYSNKKSSESCFGGTGVTHFRFVGEMLAFAAPYCPCHNLAGLKFPRASVKFVFLFCVLFFH